MWRRFLIASAVASAVSLITLGPVTASTSSPDTAANHTAPANFQGSAIDRTAVPLVDVRITLPPAECAASNAQLKAAGHAADPTCSGTVRIWGVNHQALPSGTINRTTSASGIERLLAAVGGPVQAYAGLDPGYWYWHYFYEECGINCVWKFDLEPDGEANGTNVWQWHHWCTPGGFNTSIAWCGYFYNGGGPPNYGMQFGLNGDVFYPPIVYHHGERMWVDDYGGLGYYNQW